jgi:hypothetical protein
MHPIEQDLRVTYRRMSDLTRRSVLARDAGTARTARSGPQVEPDALRDTSELVGVVSLRLTEPECCADDRMAS